MLAVQMENGLLANKVGFEILRSCKIINSRENADEGTGTHQEGIKIYRQNAIDVSILEQLGHRKMRPIQSRRVDVTTNQIMSLRRSQLRHQMRVGLLRSSVVCRLKLLTDDFNKLSGGWNSGFN